MRGLKLINPEARKKALESHLLQMRGLKLLIILKSISLLLVASFTDAWIETVDSTTIFQPQTSHLLQMRGLKQGAAYAKTLAESRIFYRCVD